MTRKPYFVVGVGMALVILLADQLSKYWVLEILDLPSLRQIVVLPFFYLTMVWNRGVTFGLFAADGELGRMILVGIASAAVIGFGFWLWRAQTWLVALSVGAIAGGAIGNVIDRIRFGAVVDFLHFHAWGWSWYVFNVADMAVVCGVAALIADGLLRPGEKTS